MYQTLVYGGIAFGLWCAIEKMLPESKGTMPTIIFTLVMMVGVATGLYGDFGHLWRSADASMIPDLSVLKSILWPR